MTTESAVDPLMYEYLETAECCLRIVTRELKLRIRTVEDEDDD